MLINLLKFKKWILSFLGIVGVALVGNFYLGVADIPLTEVPIVKTPIGEKYWFVFEDKTTKEKIRVETTKDEYFKTVNRQTGYKNPTYPNAKWVGAYGGEVIYAESVPTLKDYEYFVEDKTLATGTSPILIKLPDQNTKEVSGNYISDDKLTPSEQNELK